MSQQTMRVSVWDDGTLGAEAGIITFDVSGDVLAGVLEDDRLRFTLPPDVPFGWHVILTVTAREGQTFDFHITLAADVDVALPPAEPALPALPELVRRGQFFGLATGPYWTAIEASGLGLLARFFQGEDIEPVLAQRRDIGFNLVRVWTLMDLLPGIGQILSCDYARIPDFVRMCAACGQYVEFTAYTGINDPDHWPQLGEAALACAPRPLVEYVNELSANVNEPDADGRVMLYTKDPKKKKDRVYIKLPDGRQIEHGPAPAPVLSSHGSNGSQSWPPVPHWSYATYHTNGASEEQRKIGHNAAEIWSGPSLTNETSRCPDVGMWRTTPTKRDWRAFDSAAGAALLAAGSCYHSIAGKLGVPWAGEELACAQAWVEGARSVNLAYQDGLYRHRKDLETPALLRVYSRALSKGDEFIVRIRK